MTLEELADPARALEEIRERGYENGAHGARAARLSDAAAADVPLLLETVDDLHALVAEILGAIERSGMGNSPAWQANVRLWQQRAGAIRVSGLAR